MALYALRATSNCVLSDFTSRCSGKLEDLGDIVMNAGEHDAAITHYTDALSLHPTNAQTIELFTKRSKACMGSGLWAGALNDADMVGFFHIAQVRSSVLIAIPQVIKLDPSSPLGYDRKRVALHGAGSYGDAIVAFETMLSRMSGSPDPGMQGEDDVLCRYSCIDIPL